MKVKRLCIMVLSMLIVFSNVFMAVSFANTSPGVQVNIGSRAGKPGDTVSIPILLSNVPGSGVYGCNFEINYNPADITCKNVGHGDIISKSNDFSYEAGEGYVSMMFAPEDSVRAINKDGVFAVLDFQISKTASAGKEHALTFNYVNSDMYDVNYNDILEKSFNKGMIKVIANNPTPTTIPTPTPTPTPTQTAKKTESKLLVSLSTDKNVYRQDQVITYTVKYKNMLNTTAEGVVLKAGVPLYTTPYDNTSGTYTANTLQWNIGNLKGNATGEMQFKLKAKPLDGPSVIVSTMVTITSSNQIMINDGNQSTIKNLIYSNNMENASHKGYISGYEDNTFAPNKNVKRAEVATMLAKVLDLEIPSNPQQIYSDVPAKHWASKYIEAVSKAQLFQGYNDNTFQPDNIITRAEFATAIWRYLKLKNVQPLEIHFNDISNHWGLNYIEEVYRFKIINGYNDGSFQPKANIKRAEAVAMINRMLFRGPLKGVGTDLTDVPKTHWAYGHIVESTIDHKYTRDENGEEVFVH